VTDDPRTSNWTRATCLIWQASDEELNLILRLARAFELDFHRPMTATDLRDLVQREPIADPPAGVR